MVFTSTNYCKDNKIGYININELPLYTLAKIVKSNEDAYINHIVMKIRCGDFGPEVLLDMSDIKDGSWEDPSRLTNTFFEILPKGISVTFIQE